MLLKHQSYRNYLRAVLSNRMKVNPAYSLRALARQLGITSSQLSEVLSGKANFSLRAALKVTQMLKLSEVEADYFCWLVQLESEKDVAIRAGIIHKLNKIRESQFHSPIHDLSVDRFR